MDLFDNIVIITVLLFLIVFLYTRWLSHEITFLLAGLALLLTGQISTPDFLSGFSNENILVILMLLSLGELLRQNNFFRYIFELIYGKTKTYKGFIGVTTIFVGGLSGFFNNTPLVAIMMPYVSSWSAKNNISVSKLFIPLSYIAILGGCMTLIGTSTNLMVNGILKDSGSLGLGIFDFTLVGGAMLLIGGIYLAFFGKYLLPNRYDNESKVLSSNSRDYLVNAKITGSSKLIGVTVQNGGLRNLRGLYLVKIIRKEVHFSPIHPSFILREGDLLSFAGETSHIMDLVKNKELKLSQEDLIESAARTEIVEIVISPNSSLIGNSLKSSEFRSSFDAAAIAVHRNGEKLTGKIGEIILQYGDVLMLLTGNSFNNKAKKKLDFYIISKLDEIRNFSYFESVFIAGGGLLAIILSAIGIISLFKSLLILFCMIILLKIVKPIEVYRSIDVKLGAIIALSLAVGKGILNSDIPNVISSWLFTVNDSLGPIGVQAVLYITGAILAALVTSKAAVAIMIPICISISSQLNIDASTLFLVVSFSAAANFITPHGYQTNLMVMQIGRYNYLNFFIIGFPLTILYMIVALFILN